MGARMSPQLFSATFTAVSLTQLFDCQDCEHVHHNCCGNAYEYTSWQLF
jgi:hypothetical protein